jgi:multidrug efflux pump subunit AcrA (membrane-fusion protein)
VVADGTDPGRETPVLSLTAPARVVTTTAPLGDTTFAVGATVTVEYPDGTTAPGTVRTVGTVASNTSGQPGGEATVPITIQVDEVPESVAGFVEIPVTLQIVTKAIENAFVVPTSALVALAEGGYALEVVDSPGATHLIPVETGSFADGFVEVTGPDVADGLNVVVPS